MMHSVCDPPPPSLQARKLETQNLARLLSSRPIFIRDDTDLYFWLELCTEQFQHREGPTLTTWLLIMCHTLCMMISCPPSPPFSACPCPASIERVRQAAGWAEGEVRSGTISNGIVTAIAIVRSGGAGTVTMDGETLIHQPIVMTHRRCGPKKPNTSHSILGSSSLNDTSLN